MPNNRTIKKARHSQPRFGIDCAGYDISTILRLLFPAHDVLPPVRGTAYLIHDDITFLLPPVDGLILPSGKQSIYLSSTFYLLGLYHAII